MCTAIALAYSEVPLAAVEQHGLAARVHDRGGEREVRFYRQACPALIPCWWNGRFQLVKWGNRDRGEKKLPPTSWTWRETVEAGKWRELEPEPVVVPASFCFAGGVWYKVKQGVQALLVRTRAGEPVVYLICEPSTRYYRIMTRAEWMPCLVGEVI